MIALIEGRGREDRPPGGRGGEEKKTADRTTVVKKDEGAVTGTK